MGKDKIMDTSELSEFLEFLRDLTGENDISIDTSPEVIECWNIIRPIYERMRFLDGFASIFLDSLKYGGTISEEMVKRYTIYEDCLEEMAFIFRKCGSHLNTRFTIKIDEKVFHMRKRQGLISSIYTSIHHKTKYEEDNED
tara:strand:+ start:617 stop:1039 length:423 start_codon:yes stop_codon:yes gene_type:complete